MPQHISKAEHLKNFVSNLLYRLLNVTKNISKIDDDFTDIVIGLHNHFS